MIPDFQDCFLPLLRLLETKGQCSLKECVAQLSAHFNMNEEERTRRIPSNRQTIITNRVGWARTYLHKAGLIEIVSKGVYRLSSEGKKLLETKPSSLRAKDLEQYKSFIEFKEKRRKATDTQLNNDVECEIKTPEESMEESFREIQSSLVDDLLEKILQQSPHFFERLLVDLLEKMGYGSGEVTGRSGDGGIDGVIDEDKLGLDKIHIQAKRYKQDVKVRRPELQSFVGALAGQSGKKGVFITTSDFTTDATDYDPSNVKIVKINGRRLAELMIQYNVGVSNSMIYEIKRIDLDYFEE